MVDPAVFDARLMVVPFPLQSVESTAVAVPGLTPGFTVTVVTVENAGLQLPLVTLALNLLVLVNRGVE